jgi:hypothetical protein
MSVSVGSVIIEPDTNTPIINWVVLSGTQTTYEVRVFSQAQYSAAGFNPATSEVTYYSGIVSTWLTSAKVFNPLRNGTLYRAYVRAASGSIDSYSWGTWGASGSFNDFDVTVPRPAITSVTPVSGSTVSTGRPTLGATVAGVMNGDVRMARQFQIATNSSFTNGLVTITESTYRTLPTGTVPYPTSAPRLPQSVLYLRARILDEYGLTGEWSSLVTFTVSHPPTTGSYSPASNRSVPFNDGVVTFSWIFADSEPDDYQISAEIAIFRFGFEGSTLGGTGELFTPVQESNTYSIGVSALGVGNKDQQMAWRVRVKDTDGVWSAWSNDQTFYPRDPPTVTITSPSGSSVNSPAPTFAWTFTGSGGRTQSQYRVRVTNTSTGTAVANSGFVSASTATWTPPASVIQIGVGYTVEVTVVDSTALTATASRSFTATYTVPTAPSFTVDDFYFSTTGGMLLDWTGASGSSGFRAWRIYRRNLGATKWKLVAELPQATVSYTDYTCPSRTQVEYVLAQAVTDPTYGGVVESNYNPITTSATCDNYFIVVPDNPAYNVKLPLVKDDSLNEEYEQVSMNLIGRGRRREVGTRFGVTGKLTAQLYDDNDSSARTKKLSIERIRASEMSCYLRNPFGDVWSIGVMEAAYSRIPGVGTNEYVSVSIDYSEIEDA